MRAFLVISAISVGLLLGGCAALILPQNPEEFRQWIPPADTEKHTVNRPYKTVSDTIARKARECLSATHRVEYTEYNGPYAIRKQSTVVYKPTVQVTSARATIAVQQTSLPKAVPDFMNFQKIPPDGMYIIVADAYPHGSATRLVLYATFGDRMVIHRAILKWAAGTNMGCPDLSTIG